jgi:hypothetical protein
VDSKGQRMADFNFRTVTSKFNELVYQVSGSVCDGFRVTKEHWLLDN